MWVPLSTTSVPFTMTWEMLFLFGCRSVRVHGASGLVGVEVGRQVLFRDVLACPRINIVRCTYWDLPIARHYYRLFATIEGCSYQFYVAATLRIDLKS